ncbi:MAG TPA: SDR family NAD(P)-dependent oxidoreductase [Acidobacteriota bacterium]|nr:SDR family NAD(P)-dependent oxidoreductase [Acidobacteriota bacterium]
MTNCDGKQVLVTGAGGFIGSHLVERLVTLGADVRAFLRYDSQNRLGNLAFLTESDRKRITIVRGDLKDPEAVRRAVAGCEIVFHLAALIGIPFSYENPTDYVQTNVVGTMHVLNACRDAGVARVIVTSTSEVYGTARFAPITLAHPRQGQSPYSASKIAADALAESYARAFELPVVILRPFNTYGPRQSPRAVIPTIIRQALAGDTVRLGSAHPTRDFLYVGDTVAGFIAAGTTADLPPGIELQLGTGVETSIRDLVGLVGDVVGRSLTIVTEEKRIRPEASEVDRLLCDASVASERLDWSPRVSLRDGVAQVVAWMRSRQAAGSGVSASAVQDYVR